MAYEDSVKTLMVRKFLEIGANASFPYQHFTATGTPTANTGTGLITFAHGTTPILLTIPAPIDSGQILILRDNSATGTVSHVMTAASGTTFDGTNDTATFDAAGEQLILMSISATEWIILLNSGSVVMS
jgi:hypothetical protein